MTLSSFCRSQLGVILRVGLTLKSSPKITLGLILRVGLIIGETRYVGKFHEHPLAVVLLVCFGFFRLLFWQESVGFAGLCRLRESHFSRECLKFFKILFSVTVNYYKYCIPGAVTSRPSFVCINSEHSCPILCRCLKLVFFRNTDVSMQSKVFVIWTSKKANLLLSSFSFVNLIFWCIELKVLKT